MRKLISLIAAVSIVFSGAVSPVFAVEVLTDECLDSVVAGEIEDNLLTLDMEAQRFFKGLSSINTVDSANLVQSNVLAATGGTTTGSNSTLFGVTNIDSDSGNGTRYINNDLNLSGTAQSGEEELGDPASVGNYFAALSNLNTVDSANAVQSNIIVGGGAKYGSNTATVLNQDATVTDEELDTDNNLILDGVVNDLAVSSPQERLWAGSNLNTVDSANVVQSNITNGMSIAGGTSDNRNDADVDNDNGSGATLDTINKLSLNGDVQAELMALSNLNTVDSANAFQSNITVDSDTNYSDNYAEVTNDDGTSTDSTKYTKNTLNITEKAQHDLIALSNVNTVGSANAVQSNITVAHSTNQSYNEADVDNSDGTAGTTENEINEALTLGADVQGRLTAISNVNTIDSANAVQSNITVNYAASAISNISKNKAYVDNVDAELDDNVSDNDMQISESAQGFLRALSNLNTLDSANAVQSNVTVNDLESQTTVGNIDNESCNTACVNNEGSNGRNTMELSKDAQNHLYALSNLNTITSANAVQSNITTNSLPGCTGVGNVDNYSSNFACVYNTTGDGDAVGLGYEAPVKGTAGPDLLILGLVNGASDSPQSDLCALSNLNSVNSANAVQSNITTTTVTTGAAGNITSNSMNWAWVTNTTSPNARDNEMWITEEAQVRLCALSNLNTLSSANAVQSNITVNNLYTAGDVTNWSWNTAMVSNESGYSLMNRIKLADELNSNPTGEINDAPQSELCALSNVNTLDSANAVQSNITLTSGGIGGDICPRNLGADIGWGTIEIDVYDVLPQPPCGCGPVPNTLTIDYPVSFELVGPVFGVATDIDEIENWSMNWAMVYNDGGQGSGADILYIGEEAQLGLKALSNLNTVHSANAVQSNITVNVGDVTGPDTVDNHSMNMAWVTNIRRLGYDDLIMKDRAQENLMALSNVNAVESATAVQSNITVSTVTDPMTTVDNSSCNIATVINSPGYNSTALSYKDSVLSLSGTAQKNLMALSNLNTVSSATAVQSNITVSTGTGTTNSTNCAWVINR